MKNKNMIHLLCTRNVAVLTLLVLALGLHSQAEADDRDLFRTASGAPYLFVLFDNTGSMQWRPSADDDYCADSNVGDRSIGLADPLCTATRIDDSPQSRLYQAKSALYDMLDDADGVRFGFATFPPQTEMRVRDIREASEVPGGPLLRYLYHDGGDTSCGGIEQNTDSWSDDYYGYNILQQSSATTTGLSIGDLIPFDWGNNNREKIQHRLAPNLIVDPNDGSPPPVATVPDFGIARYFAKDRTGSYSSGYYELNESYQKPFLARGTTPLANSLLDFKSWYDNWKTKVDPPGGTPKDGINPACREVNVILMTDGVERCSGETAARGVADDLWNPGAGAQKIKTFVVGFATNNPELDKIAEKGGSPEYDCDGEEGPGTALCHAYTAANKEQLTDAFEAIVGEIRTRSRTFASAAVPSVIGTASENVYLTSFNPTEDPESLWPGRVDAFIKPVPLTLVDGDLVPDIRPSVACDLADPTDNNCLAWDAAKRILLQAPTTTDLDGSIWRVGTGATNRRIVWGTEVADAMPESRQAFVPPADDTLRTALYGDGFGFAEPLGADLTNGIDVVKFFLKQKTAMISDPLEPTNLIEIDYILGDIFHSDPEIVAEPKRFDYFANDLEGELTPCAGTNDRKDRYPCFVRDQIGRRRVFFVGSNEGALHAFDAGSAFRPTGSTELDYTAGTGLELFAYVPRAVMPTIRSMAEEGGQRYTVDGPVTVDDVLRDPEFTSGTPNPDDREWRTVVIGGLREGGSAYYALDVTQPDAIDDAEGGTGLPINDPDGPGCVLWQSAPTEACPRPYPEIMWEFSDSWDDPHPTLGGIKQSDEDGNGKPDLGDTWSKVNTGRILLDDGSEDGLPMYVAIFGGGMDPEFKDNADVTEASGNYLYMVDIETGKVVYKRKLDVKDYETGDTAPAMVPSEPAAVDTDQDSFLDTIYIGNTAGYLYKVDMSARVPLATGVEIDDHSGVLPGTEDADEPSPAIRTVNRITDPKWDPFPIFNTQGRPIYYPPSVIFVPEQGLYALAFGTGDREDLWSPELEEVGGGRVYVLLDTGFAIDPMSTTPPPLTVANLPGFDASDNTTGDINSDLLAEPATNKRAGYYLDLDAAERLISRPLGLSGLVFFSTYVPEESSVDNPCKSLGESRLYAVFTTNGVGIEPEHHDRYRDVGEFVTSPYVEASDAAGARPSDTDAVDPAGASGACAGEAFQAIRQALQDQMPQECTFAQYSLDVMTLEAKSGIECVVPIPVCVIQRNWKEF